MEKVDTKSRHKEDRKRQKVSGHAAVFAAEVCACEYGEKRTEQKAD